MKNQCKKNIFITDKPGSVARERFSGVNLMVYNTIKKAITDIIEGRISSTVVTIPFRPKWVITKVDTKADKEHVLEMIDLNLILYCLRMECPLEFCWYNELRAKVTNDSFDLVPGKYEKDIFLNLPASSDYKTEDCFVVNQQKIKEAQLIPEKAMELVRKYEHCTDIEKLDNYHREITERALHSRSYMDGKQTADGDNYQMIALFNYEKGKAEMCCSGFSKAFQYVCSLSQFENTSCYMVAGDVKNGRKHMWNVFRFQGCNYMTDLMWSTPNRKIFMPECIQHSPEQCTIQIKDGSKHVYQYEKNTLQLYGDQLEIGIHTSSDKKQFSVEMPQIEILTNEDDTKTIQLSCPTENSEIYYNILEPDPEQLIDDKPNMENLYREPFTMNKAGMYYITATAKIVSETGEDIWSKTNSIAIWVSDHSCGDNLKWEMNLVSGTLYISGTGEMWDFEIQQAPWYPYIKNIRSVVCDYGVTTIGKCAFWWCTSLREVSLPSSITRIRKSAFDTCSILGKIEFPNQVAIIDECAFQRCCSLDHVIFGRWIQQIGKNAFLDCHPSKVSYRGKKEEWEKIKSDIVDEGNSEIKKVVF